MTQDRTKDRQTLERERELGCTAEPCDCGWEKCTGWTFGSLIGHGIGRPIGVVTDQAYRFGRDKS